MNGQLYIICGLAFALIAGFFAHRGKGALAFACAFVAMTLITCGPAIASLP